MPLPGHDQLTPRRAPSAARPPFPVIRQGVSGLEPLA